MPSTVGIVASGEDVLNDAVFWIDAGRSSISNGALTNLGTGGSALNAVFGNSTGTDSFDPALLTHTGTNYLYLPGVNLNYASTSNATALNITGDIEIVMRVGLASWTPATATVLASRDSTDPNRAWHARIESSGRLALRWFPTGSAASSIISTANATPPFVSGAVYWLKWTLDVDNGASGNTARFYYAADQSTEPTTWTQIGTDVITAGVTSMVPVTAVLSIGSTPTGISAGDEGRYFRCIVRNGIGGTTVFDANFTTGITSGAQTTFTESSANAATVTISRATSGRKSVAVTRPILLFGTDDYMQVADNDLLDFGASDSFTVVAVARQWATPVSFTPYVRKTAGGSAAGWSLYNNLGNQIGAWIADGTTRQFTNVPTYTYGALTTRTVIVNRVTNGIAAWNNGTATAATSISSIGSAANGNLLEIGNQQDMELVAAAVWRRALNANEIATIVNRYT